MLPPSSPSTASPLARRSRPRRWGRVLATLTLGLTGCTSPRAPAELPGITPPAPRGRTVTVDVCNLLPPSAASAVVGRQLQVVGRTVEPTRLETLRCDLGQRFAEPVVTVELTTDPVALAVFESAYGDTAGGDPRLLPRMHSSSVLRTEGDQQSIHSFVRGAVISVRTNLSLVQPIRQRQLIELSRLAIRNLPDNPVLAKLNELRRCRVVSGAAVENVIARPVTLTQEVDLGGAVECSWGAQPGSLVVSMTVDRRAFERWQETVTTDAQYAEVGGIAGVDGLTAYSSDESSGDLVVLAAPRVYRFTLVPAPGFSGSDIPTTPEEEALATEVVTTLR